MLMEDRQGGGISSSRLAEPKTGPGLRTQRDEIKYKKPRPLCGSNVPKWNRFESPQTFPIERRRSVASDHGSGWSSQPTGRGVSIATDRSDRYRMGRTPRFSRVLWPEIFRGGIGGINPHNLLGAATARVSYADFFCGGVGLNSRLIAGNQMQSRSTDGKPNRTKDLVADRRCPRARPSSKSTIIFPGARSTSAGGKKAAKFGGEGSR
jgi:hypothetical protein